MYKVYGKGREEEDVEKQHKGPDMLL